VNRPSLPMRSIVSLFRTIPSIRGRGRVENVLHRALEQRQLGEVMRVNGYEIEVSLDDLIGRTIYINGIWEPHSTMAMRRLLHPGAVVFDIGANTGYYTLLFAEVAGERGRIYAFEPVPSTIAILKRNLARNASLARRVELIEVALSDHEGFVTLNVASERNLGASHVVAAEVVDAGRTAAGLAGTVTIQSRTADSVWNEQERPAVDLVKLDIEGHEYHALRGMHELIAASPAISILVEVRETFLIAAGTSSDQLFAHMRSLGLTSYDFDEARVRFVRNDATRAGELVIFSRRRLEE
jgi:FkbM family methyltransferase